MKPTFSLLLALAGFGCAIALLIALCGSSHISSGAIRGSIVGTVFLLHAGFGMMEE